MSTEAYFPQEQVTIPFLLAGREGTVAVTYGANLDPARAGFDAIAGLNIPLERCRGYPMMHARIEAYAGFGYRMFCGWIQVVTRECLARSDQGWEEAERSSSVDLAPSLSEAGVPFAVQGPLPALFDAPCLNLGDCAALRWTADTFLTTVPLRSREEAIVPLLGFRWGYYEIAPAPGMAAGILPLEVTDARAWARHLALLRREFPGWRFAEMEG